jgi:phasin family protein
MTSKSGGAANPFDMTKLLGDMKMPGLPDMTKIFADMKFPALPDMSAFAAAQQRNVEALTAANKMALEGAQAVARRHAEIVQKAVADMTAGIQALSGPEAPQAKAAKQAELLKQTYASAVANLKELSDLIQHANAEAVQVLNARFVAALDEVKALAEKA